MFEIIGALLLAAARGFRHRAFHGAGDFIGIEHDLAFDITRGAANGLDERGFRAQKAFFVGIENGDQCAFGNIEAFAQQVDADQYIEGAKA